MQILNWEELLWGLLESTKPYTVDEWRRITDGLIDSFCKFLDIPFEHAKPAWFELEHREQCMGLALIYKFQSPIESLIYCVRGGVTTYIDNDERTFDVSLLLFLYFGKTRLLGERDDTPNEKNDFITYTFDRTPSGKGKWTNRGWQQGFMDEWLGQKMF